MWKSQVQKQQLSGVRNLMPDLLSVAWINLNQLPGSLTVTTRLKDVTVPIQGIVQCMTPVKLNLCQLAPKHSTVLCRGYILTPGAVYCSKCTVSPTSAAGELHLQNYYVSLVGLKLKPLVSAHSIFWGYTILERFRVDSYSYPAFIRL